MNLLSEALPLVAYTGSDSEPSHRVILIRSYPLHAALRLLGEPSEETRRGHSDDQARVAFALENYYHESHRM